MWITGSAIQPLLYGYNTAGPQGTHPLRSLERISVLLSLDGSLIALAYPTPLLSDNLLIGTGSFRSTKAPEPLPYLNGSGNFQTTLVCEL